MRNQRPNYNICFWSLIHSSIVFGQKWPSISLVTCTTEPVPMSIVNNLIQKQHHSRLCRVARKYCKPVCESVVRMLALCFESASAVSSLSALCNPEAHSLSPSRLLCCLSFQLKLQETKHPHGIKQNPFILHGENRYIEHGWLVSQSCRTPKCLAFKLWQWLPGYNC